MTGSPVIHISAKSPKDKAKKKLRKYVARTEKIGMMKKCSWKKLKVRNKQYFNQT
jgi:hypothetical protein